MNLRFFENILNETSRTNSELGNSAFLRTTLLVAPHPLPRRPPDIRPAPGRKLGTHTGRKAKDTSKVLGFAKLRHRKQRVRGKVRWGHWVPSLFFLVNLFVRLVISSVSHTFTHSLSLSLSFSLILSHSLLKTFPCC